MRNVNPVAEGRLNGEDFASNSLMPDDYDDHNTDDSRVGTSTGSTCDYLEQNRRSMNESPKPSEPPPPVAPVAHWQRELATSRAGRHSRASSIISTRTRLTHQSDDAHSVEFEAGGQSFRISRDGSEVTNTTAPPPYPGPPLDQLVEESDEEEDSEPPRGSTETLRDDLPRRGLRDYTLPIRTHVLPDGAAAPYPAEDERPQAGFEFPRRLRSMLTLRWPTANATTTTTTPSALTQSRNTIHFRRTQSDSSSLANFRPFANESSEGQQGEDSSSSSPLLEAKRHLRNITWDENIITLDDTDEQTAEISGYYHRIIVDMDREHRRRLRERDEELKRRDEELKQARILVNEKDIINRQQIRERDHAIETLTQQLRNREVTINGLKTQLYDLGNDLERQIEKARNDVEDMWEERWKEYQRLLLERRPGSAKSNSARSRAQTLSSSSFQGQALSKSPHEEDHNNLAPSNTTAVAFHFGEAPPDNSPSCAYRDRDFVLRT